MSPLVAHAGEEALYVVIPFLLIAFFVYYGKRRHLGDEPADEQTQADPTSPTDDDAV